MKVYIELTGECLSAIQKELRVTRAMRTQFVKNPIAITEAEVYALRIINVRRMLDLSLSEAEICWDHKAEELEPKHQIGDWGFKDGEEYPL